MSNKWYSFTSAARVFIEKTAEISVSITKAFTISINFLHLLSPLSHIFPHTLLDEFKKNNPAAYGTVLSGLFTFTCVAYLKYLQMVPPKEKQDDDLLLTTPISQCNKTKSFLHAFIAGTTYIYTDIALQSMSFEKLMGFIQNKDSRSLLSILLNTASSIPLIIQDTRLIFKTYGKQDAAMAQLGEYVENFKETTLGKITEFIAVLYRTIASKMSLLSLLYKAPHLGFMAFQLYNPFSFYCKWTNNQTAFEEIMNASNTEILFSKILASFLALSYVIEDAALYTNALSEIFSLSPEISTIMLGTLIAFEFISYFSKCEKPCQFLTVKLSTYLKTTFFANSTLNSTDNRLQTIEDSVINSSKTF